jgi:16S rRNA processing protein RimM
MCTGASSSAGEPGETWVEVGRIGKPFGLKGEVVVHVWGDTADRFSPGSELFLVSQGGRRPVKVAAVRPMPRKLVVRFAGCERLEDVEPWVNCVLEVRARDLPRLGRDESYHFELIGLRVYASDGSFVGVLEEILATGGNDVYCIRGGGREILIPATREAIAEVDPSSGRMVLSDLEGLLEP